MKGKNSKLVNINSGKTHLVKPSLENVQVCEKNGSRSRYELTQTMLSNFLIHKQFTKYEGENNKSVNVNS